MQPAKAAGQIAEGYCWPSAPYKNRACASQRIRLKLLDPPAPEDLYGVINERYERGSIVLTRHAALA